MQRRERIGVGARLAIAAVSDIALGLRADAFGLLDGQLLVRRRWPPGCWRSSGCVLLSARVGLGEPDASAQASAAFTDASANSSSVAPSSLSVSGSSSLDRQPAPRARRVEVETRRGPTVPVMSPTSMFERPRSGRGPDDASPPRRPRSASELRQRRPRSTGRSALACALPILLVFRDRRECPLIAWVATPTAASGSGDAAEAPDDLTELVAAAGGVGHVLAHLTDRDAGRTGDAAEGAEILRRVADHVGQHALRAVGRPADLVEPRAGAGDRVEGDRRVARAPWPWSAVARGRPRGRGSDRP